MLDRDSSVENYVKRLIKLFLRAGSLRSLGVLEHSSKLFSRFFLRKKSLALNLISNSCCHRVGYLDLKRRIAMLNSTWIVFLMLGG